MSGVRIFLDYRPALRQRTGAGEWVHELARALIRRFTARGEGDELWLFTSSWRDRPAASLPNELPGAQIVDRRIPVRLLNFAWHRLGWPPIEQLATATFDVVHSPHPLLLPARRGLRVVTIHDLDFLHHPERAHAEVRRDYPSLVRSHARRADLIIVSSSWTGREVQRELGVPPEKLVLCPAGWPAWLQHVSARPFGAPNARHLLFVGTLEQRKNIEGLIESYGRLVARRPDAPPLKLVGKIVGHGSWQDRISSPPLAGRVEVLGYVSETEKAALYQEAAALVLPSFHEGFGLPVLEAMALGVPVIASRRGSLPEVAGDAALFVDPEEPESIVSAMEKVLMNRSLADELVERGRLQAARFDWQASAGLLLDAYDEALAARGGMSAR